MAYAAVTAATAAAFIGISASEPTLPGLLATAESAVATYLKPDGVAAVPDAVRAHAVCTAATELHRRRISPGGVASWSPDGSSPVRLAADFMKPVRGLLDPYRGCGSVG